MLSYLLNRKMIESDGRSWPWPPNRRIRKLFRRLFDIRKGLVRDVEIIDGHSRYRFQCRNFDEFSRCMKMFIKEPGTCDWIKQELIPGEIFYDIGANIGVYTVLAAKCTGETGKVFAFEPHCGSFSRLLENIHVNNLENIVTPCNFALHDQQGFFPFKYFSGEAASSQSQIAADAQRLEHEFQSRVSELKYVTSIDALIAMKEFPPPHHVKIDVDGNEFVILRGMSTLMKSSQRPKSIQVEIDKPYQKDIMSFMEGHKYFLATKHYTRAGLERISAGQNPEDILYNAIFRPS